MGLFFFQTFFPFGLSPEVFTILGLSFYQFISIFPLGFILRFFINYIARGILGYTNTFGFYIFYQKQYFLFFLSDFILRFFITLCIGFFFFFSNDTEHSIYDSDGTGIFSKFRGTCMLSIYIPTIIGDDYFLRGGWM